MERDLRARLSGNRVKQACPEVPPHLKRPTTSPEFPLTQAARFYALVPFMKVVSSIKSAKKRHPDCQVVRRRGKIYVINKTDPRYKARQG